MKQLYFPGAKPIQLHCSTASRMNCKLLDAENISSQRWEDGTVLRDGSLNARGLFVPGPEGISVFTATLPNEVQVSGASSILRVCFDQNLYRYAYMYTYIVG